MSKKITLIIVLSIIIGGFLCFYYIGYGNMAWIITVLTFPLIIISDLPLYLIGSLKGEKQIVEDKNYRIFIGYFAPICAIIYSFVTIAILYIYKEKPHSQALLNMINVLVGFSAIMAVIGQLTHLISSIYSKYIRFNFATLLLLFFISYITCGLSFSLMYLLDFNCLKYVANDNRIIDTIYFSFTTLATTGFGDILPNTNYARFLVMAENLVGLFLTGYLISVILNFHKQVGVKE